ncbi:hypothetical protein [Rhizobium sp. LCM 4573]|uniref:hypothetical protein n=1 Tax=Rhizobium sp. LCM 4573 TaxID=1848291 RepID=UPI0008D91C5C|nr:hypothetical protein [Rhizobium sp. LCM 4573]OHV81600.1 hypothetical protein LCM4573_21180 [Rhizobium sp. LCM 4573]
MHISLSPRRDDATLSVVKSGDILTINGDHFDFTDLPDGATIPAREIPCDWICGPVERVNGKVHLSLCLPHGPNPSPAVAFPAPIIDPPDGDLIFPSDPVEEADDVEA